MSIQFLIPAILFGIISLVESRSYETGLIFYDLQTKNIILPPTLSVSRGRSLSNMKYSSKGSIWSTFGRTCSCRGLLCGCCTGLKVKRYSFDRKMCANFTYVPDDNITRIDVFLNEKNLARYGISMDNPDPLCIPVMMPIPMAMCIQLSDISFRDNNLNMCMDFVVRLETAEIMEMHFQCMRMGANGLQYVDKDGKPVFPRNDTRQEVNTDYDDEDETISDEYDLAENSNDVNDEEEYTSNSDDEENIETEINENELNASNGNIPQLTPSHKKENETFIPSSQVATNKYIHVLSL